MTITETLVQYGFKLIDTTDEGDIYATENSDDYTTYVSVALGDGVIQAVKMPVDHEQATTVIHFNRLCDELTDLLKKWADVTPAEFN